MDMFEFVSAARGYHMYKDIWEPSVGEKLIALRDSSNHFHKLAVSAQWRRNSGPSTMQIRKYSG